MSVKVNDWIHAAATEAAAKLREKLDSLVVPSPRPRCSTAKPENNNGGDTMIEQEYRA
jgi:hypothetical protein